MRDNAKEQGAGSRKGTNVTIHDWKSHPSYKHRVSWIQDNEPKSRGFKLLKDAKSFKAAKSEELGTFGIGDSPTGQERAAILESRDKLAKVGLTLREAIRIAIEVKERDDMSATVAEVVSKLIQAKADTGKSKRHVDDLNYRQGLFKKAFGDRIIASISHDEVFDWIQAQSDSAVSRNNFRRHCSLLFNFAKKRKYISENPVDQIDEWKGTNKAVEIIEPKEMDEFLRKAPTAIVPALAIGAFAGLRRSEIGRLKWEHVDLESGEIYVDALNHKSAANRFVPIEANLREWLLLHHKDAGDVWPTNGKKLFTAAKKAVSFEVPNNVLRHCYGSYHIAKYNNGPKASANLGQSNVKEVFASYRKPIKKPFIDMYWNISPVQAENVVSIKNAAA